MLLAIGAVGQCAMADGLGWPQSWAEIPIAPKESVPIVVVVALWGPLWKGKQIQCFCDNMTVIYTVNKVQHVILSSCDYCGS